MKLLSVNSDYLYKDSIQKIKSDLYQIDELIASNNDNRFGITLVIRPDKKVRKEIQKLLNKIKKVEPNQYFYPDSDIHITVMSIISCYDGFDLKQIEIEDYINMIQNSIEGLGCFNIEFRGVTASPSCLMVKVFLADETLNQFRNNLRNNFKESNLEQSLDKRYAIQTAHSTIFRLKKRFTNKAEFLKIVEEYRNYNFGTFSVNTVEFVFNDWYQRKEYVKTLYKFELK